jgi:hypothetical protein
MTLETTLSELQQTILEHLRRSKEPMSDLYFQHKLTYDAPALTMEQVTRAITKLLELGLIRVADTRAVDYEKIRFLTLAERGARRTVSAETRRKMSEAQRRRAVRGPLSDATKRKIAEVFRGRKFSEETRRKISDGLRRRHAAKKALGIAPTPLASLNPCL